MIVIKRTVIVGMLLLATLLLEMAQSDTLLINYPTRDQLLESYATLLERRREIEKQIEDTDADDVEAMYETLFNDAVHHLFLIEFTQREFDNLVTDMETYHNRFGTYQSNRYRPVTVTYVAADTTVRFENVGLRSYGDRLSRRLPIAADGSVREFHFKLKFDETFDLFPEEALYDELRGRSFAGLDNLLFKWNQQQDATYANEVFSYEMLRSVGVPAPNASFAEVRIAVEDRLELVAFYNIVEVYDAEFIRRWFHTDVVGDLYEARQGGTLETIRSSEEFGVSDWRSNTRPLYTKQTNRDTYTFDELIRFTMQLNDADPTARKQFLELRFDVDTFLRTMAMTVLLGNTDDYRANGNNAYYYIDPSGYMTYLPWAYDNTMGSGWSGYPAFRNDTIDNDIYGWGWYDWNHFAIPLWDNIIVYESYRARYEDYLEQFIVEDIFSDDAYRNMVQTIDELYGDAFALHYDKSDYMEQKRESVLAQLAYHRLRQD